MPLKVLLQYLHAHLITEGADTCWSCTHDGDLASIRARMRETAEQAKRSLEYELDD